MKYLFTITLLFSIPLSVQAGSLKGAKEIRSFTDKIMSHVGKGSLDEAFQEMKSVAVVAAIEIDSVAIQSKAQREQYGQRYGASIGYEFVSEKAVGQSLLRLQYIEKTNKQTSMPFLGHFIFIKHLKAGN